MTAESQMDDFAFIGQSPLGTASVKKIIISNEQQGAHWSHSPLLPSFLTLRQNFLSS